MHKEGALFPLATARHKYEIDMCTGSLPQKILLFSLPLMATGMLQLMEKNGLILRESVASDARLKSLILTEKAVHLDEQVREYLHQTEQCLTQGLSRAQLALFLETAERMSANLDG